MHARTHLKLTVPGIQKVEANLKDQLVFIEGTAPPSTVVSAIQATGRDAILRGSGSTNSTLFAEFCFFPFFLC